MCSGQHPQSRCSSQETVQSGFEVGEKRTGRMLYDQFFFPVTWPGQDLTSDLMTSPLDLLLLHDLLALLSPPFVDGVAWVIDLESVLVVHVSILDFSGLLIKLQNMGHPKSDGESSKNSGRRSTKLQLCRTFTERLGSFYFQHF